jgi:RNA polymerase sigma factor (TIGR02999 family)
MPFPSPQRRLTAISADSCRNDVEFLTFAGEFASTASTIRLMGNEAAGSDALFTMLYNELHRLARRETARAGPDAPLGATTLLHEAYLDMSQRHALAFPDRARFLAYAAKAMRALVIDHVRERGAQKRGGGLHITSLDTQTAENCAEPEVLSEIGAALDDLATFEPALAHLVDLKFFCGFSVAEIASLQGVSERTVQRQWEKARTLLYRSLAPGQ